MEDMNYSDSTQYLCLMTYYDQWTFEKSHHADDG